MASTDKTGQDTTENICPLLSAKDRLSSTKMGFFEPQKFPSIIRLLLVLSLCVFVVESSVETFLSHYDGGALSTHIFLDATITVLLLFPLFHYLLYSPLHKLDVERRGSELEIVSLSRQLIRTTEEERHALARDLHDDFGQRLTALQLGIETIKLSSERGLLEPEESREKLTSCLKQSEKLSALIADLGDRVRAISGGLRPTMLDELGLIPTLEWLVEDFTEQHKGIRLKLRIGEVNERFQPELELTVFRICQEALNNIAKHAHAGSVLVEFDKAGSDLVLRVKDDGVGFGAGELQTARAGRRGTGKQGVGLIGMRERAALVNGSLEFKSIKGQGSEVLLTLPTLRQQRRGD